MAWLCSKLQRGFLWRASAKGQEEGDAKSARWLLELEDADPYIAL